MTYAGAFGLPQSGAPIVVHPGREPLRVTGYEFDRRRNHAEGEERRLSGLTRELVALKAKKK